MSRYLAVRCIAWLGANDILSEVFIFEPLLHERG
jgi:hypothetical protein